MKTTVVLVVEGGVIHAAYYQGAPVDLIVADYDIDGLSQDALSVVDGEEVYLSSPILEESQQSVEAYASAFSAKDDHGIV